MSQTYQTRRRAQDAPAARKFRTSVPGPSLSELAAGAMPSAEQMGRRVDLPGAIREKMEASFGADFSGVNVYESQTVADAGAQAVTMGSNVAFAPGQLDLTSTAGQALLGHELSHVVSQARGESAGRGFLADAGLESQADRQGMLAARGESAYSGPVGPLSASAVPASAGPIQAAGKTVDKEDQEELDYNDVAAANGQEGLVTNANLPSRFHFIKRGQSLARLRRMRAERLAQVRANSPESKAVWAEVDAMMNVAAAGPFSGRNYGEEMEQARARTLAQSQESGSEPAPPASAPPVPAPPAPAPPVPAPPTSAPPAPVDEESESELVPPAPLEQDQSVVPPAPVDEGSGTANQHRKKRRHTGGEESGTARQHRKKRRHTGDKGSETASAPADETSSEFEIDVSPEQVARLVGNIDDRRRGVDDYLRGSMPFHSEEERANMTRDFHADPGRMDEEGKKRLLNYVAGDIEKFLAQDIKGLNSKKEEKVLRTREDLEKMSFLTEGIQAVLPYLPEDELRARLGSGRGTNRKKANKLDKFNRKAGRFREAMEGAKTTRDLLQAMENPGNDKENMMKMLDAERIRRKLRRKKAKGKHLHNG